MVEPMDRRGFLGIAVATGVSTALARRTAGGPAGAGDRPATEASAPARPSRPFLTEAGDFVDVSRGNPKPFTLKGEALARARLTADTWRLEIVGDGSSTVARPRSLEQGNALDLAGLHELAEKHGVAYVKAMQCNNIPAPLGQGLWEGVPLRDVLRRVGRVSNVRRVYYWGFHNDDPAQLFQSSLAFNRVLETPPGEPPPLVAFRLNGREIPLERGGPVRMIVPWAHGFKSVKWLQRIVLTNDYKANDTYALKNNDPESYLKTAAYLGKGLLSCKAGVPLVVEGTAMAGWSGLQAVECWVRRTPAGATVGVLAEDDPAWDAADWRPCDLMPRPDDWSTLFPGTTSPQRVWGFDPRTGQPREWPLRYSMVPWTTRIGPLEAGTYEIRARSIDLNGFAQPEPRPYPKSGMNMIPCQTLIVSA